MEIRTNKFEARIEGQDIEGIASTVNQRYDLGYFEEEIAPGAFDSALNDDVAVLFNHDPNLVLARTKSGTADLFLDDKGNLAYRYTTPNRQFARDVEDMIKTGDVYQSSFAFTVAEGGDRWEWASRSGREKDLRIITKVERLYDVSPVTYPANPTTSVRAMEERNKEIWESAKRSAQEEEKTAEQIIDEAKDNEPTGSEVTKSNVEFYKRKLKTLER